MLRRLGRVSGKRSGTVRLITAARSGCRDHCAARHCYRRLLTRGVSIFEYRPQKLHMKLIVADDVTYIGSANFDMRNLFCSEIMLDQDAALAASMRTFMDEHIAQGAAIDPRRTTRSAG